jgi:porphobilinogen deaminase
VLIRIATRKSPLALAQTRWVADRMRAHRADVVIEEVHVVTEGAHRPRARTDHRRPS